MNIQRVLLDTHILIWMDENNSQLSKDAKDIIENADIEIFLSVASIWEMQLKIAKNRLNIPKGLRQLIDSQMLENDLQLLNISANHIFVLENLPDHHKDPFDRLIIAQAIHEEMAIISVDSEFSKYKLPVIK